MVLVSILVNQLWMSIFGQNLLSMRTLAIGDIHGGLKGLTQVIEIAKVTKEDTLIFVGDYVDGWSESAQVIQYLMFFIVLK